MKNRIGFGVAIIVVLIAIVVFATLRSSNDGDKTFQKSSRAVSVLMLEGPYKSYAENEQAGINLAAVDIAKEEGTPLAVSYKSFDGDPDKGLQALKTAVARDGHQFVAEVFGTSAALAACDFANANRIVIVSGVNTGHLLTEKMGKHCFRIIPSDGEAVQASMKWASELGGKRAGVVSVTTDWGKGLGEMLDYYASQYGIQIIAHQSVDKSHAVFEPQVSALKTAAVEVVFLAINPDQAANFVRAAQDLNFKPIILGTDNLTSGEFTSGAGDAALGVRYVLPPISAETPAKKEIVDRLRARLKLPPTEDPHPFALYGYDVAWTVHHAIKASGGDPEKAVAFLESYKGVGVTGPIQFTKNHDLVLAGPYRRMQIERTAKGIEAVEVH